jgi:hypothetical protein
MVEWDDERAHGLRLRIAGDWDAEIFHRIWSKQGDVRCRHVAGYNTCSSLGYWLTIIQSYDAMECSELFT